MSPEESRFLERVCADPDDDRPRLIFADWLDERDDPRGEFIRVQVALARLPADHPRRPELMDREAALLGRYHGVWSDALRRVAGWAEFRRGFIETVNIEARTFLHRAADLFRLAPIRHVRFLDVGGTLERLMESRQLERLSAVTIFAQHIDERLARALVDCPHLGGLQSLNIGRNRVGDRGAERLAWSPRFQNLVELDLSDNAIGDTGARALAESTNLRNVQALQLRRNELSRAGLGYLCRSTVLDRLRHVGLALNYIGAPHDCLPPSGGVVRLASLDLSDNELTPEGTELLTSLPGLGELSRLVLERNEIGSPGAATLADWSGAASLRSLILASNRVGDEGARRLARSNYLHQLTELNLSDNPIHNPGAFEFLNSRALPRLRRLVLPHLGLTPQIRRALSARYPG